MTDNAGAKRKPPWSVETWIKLSEKVYGPMVRYLILANSGGAIASISFLGASVDRAELTPYVIGPLACFFIGILFAGITVFAMMAMFYQRHSGSAQPISPLGIFGHQLMSTFPVYINFYVFVSFLAFFVGGMLGILMLLNL